MSSTPSKEPLATIERRTILEAVESGKRLDGRSPNDYRELAIELNPIPKAEGSAQVTLGKTKILVGVKVDVGSPFPDTPDQGVLTVNAELVPLASPLFEPGPPNENAIELARVVDRGIRESGAIDLKKLCIIPGEKVIVVFVDIYVLDHDGNLIDASALAALASLLKTKIKKYELKENEIVFKDKYESLPLKNRAYAVTVAKLGKTLVVDPCLDEEYIMDTRVTMTLDEKGAIRAMQKGGLGALTISELKEILDIVTKKSQELKKILEGAVK